MDPLANPMKHRLREATPLTGLWLQLTSGHAAEAVAYSGFDWLLIDAEHAPNDLATIYAQLQALGRSESAVIVRPQWNDTVLFKRLLDMGVQSFLVPFVQNAEEARRAVSATRYPPQGVRGVAYSHRGNRFSHVPDYMTRANDEICVILQIESREALSNLEQIAQVPGVDALFIGPSDLSADMGHIGNPGHPEVQAAIDDALARCQRIGMPLGIFGTGVDDIRRRFAAGFRFAPVGSDVGTLIKAAEQALAAVRAP
jgi:4-hydroxy-2-oxoheptanedioate aldolase